MREVSQFVIVFPARLTRQGGVERQMLLDAMRREYPHYEFEPGPSFALEDEFRIIPIVGVLAGGDDPDPDRIYMCKPLDPKVIPDLVATLQAYDILGASVN